MMKTNINKHIMSRRNAISTSETLTDANTLLKFETLTNATTKSTKNLEQHRFMQGGTADSQVRILIG